ncbi:hypothetical protein ACMFMF_005149 [Clarireedia jacksonii]
MPFATATGIALTAGPQAAAGIGQETGYAFAEADALAVVFADIKLENATASAETSNHLQLIPSTNTQD